MTIWRHQKTYEGRYAAFLIEACDLVKAAELPNGRSTILGQGDLARRLGCSPWYLNRVMPDIVEQSTRMWPGYCLQVGWGHLTTSGMRVKMYRIVNKQNIHEFRTSNGRIKAGVTKIERGMTEIQVELAKPGARVACAFGEAGLDMLHRAVVELANVEPEMAD